MEADRRPPAIVEHDDRWLLKPLRGRSVSRIDWTPDHLELILDGEDFRILVGYEAELSVKSLAKESPTRHRIDYWNRPQVEEFLDSRIVSAVFFKTGAFRLGFKNGWILVTEPDRQDYSPEVRIGGLTLWNTSGIANRSLFEIVPIDPWTGQRVAPPNWPSRPSSLRHDPDSDDIND